jgi:hypothetical protein
MSEHTIVFGPSNGLVGTLSLPAAARGDGATLGFLLFNAGVVHRVGPHRINVRLARQLEARGIPSMRFDLAGHGDSARPSGECSFEEQAVVDVRAAMDALGAAASVRRFAIFGICSGAYHGFQAALADERVRALLLFDAYRYPTLRTHVRRTLTRLRQPRALRGILGVARRGVASLARRARGTASRHEEPPAPELGRVNFIPSKEEFARGLRTLLDRGVKIRMIYTGDALREYNYEGQFHDVFSPLGVGHRIEADFLPDLDHVATPLAARADLTRRILAWSADLSGP